MFKKKKIVEIVPCEDCKCLMYKKHAQEIDYIFKWNLAPSEESKRYYCPNHKKNYDSQVDGHDGHDGYRSFYSPFSETVDYDCSTYFKEMQVDENGEPVGYKKIKK